MNNSLSDIGIDRFLNKQQFMSICPYINEYICIQGQYQFYAKTEEYGEIRDKYSLKILIPVDFPEHAPKVWEINGVITKELAQGHMFVDENLCLGSPFSISSFIHEYPDLEVYCQKFLIPYLYAISYKREHGGELIFGELEHGLRGIADDFLNLSCEQELTYAIELINRKKRIANKKICPCGCGKRLGVCKLHYKINVLRESKDLFKQPNLSSKEVFSTDIIDRRHR